MAEAEHLARLAAELDDIRLILKARREAKYSPDQPRDWHGRWTSGGGDDRPPDAAAGGGGEAFGQAPDGTAVEPVGGIPDDKLNWTTQQFMSAYCKANIREVMPG